MTCNQTLPVSDRGLSYDRDLHQTNPESFSPGDSRGRKTVETHPRGHRKRGAGRGGASQNPVVRHYTRKRNLEQLGAKIRRRPCRWTGQRSLSPLGYAGALSRLSSGSASKTPKTIPTTSNILTGPTTSAILIPFLILAVVLPHPYYHILGGFPSHPLTTNRWRTLVK